MTIILTVTQEDMKQKFADFAEKVLGKNLESSDVAIVSERTPSKISKVERTDFLSVIKDKGFSIPESIEDIAVVSVVQTQKTTTTKKMKR